MNKWMEYLKIPQDLYNRAAKAEAKLHLPLIPAEQQVYRKLLMTSHQTGSKQFWWDQDIAKCRHCQNSQPDNHFHVFWECQQFPMLVWTILIHHCKPLLELSDNCKPSQRLTNEDDGALCLFALATDGKLAPLWWVLVQRITLRNIWNFYTDHKYGTGPEPLSETYAINTAKYSISSFKQRIKLEFEQAMNNFRLYEGSEDPITFKKYFNRTWTPAAEITFQPSQLTNSSKKQSKSRGPKKKPLRNTSVHAQAQIYASQKSPFPGLFGLNSRQDTSMNVSHGTFSIRFHPCLDEPVIL